MSEEKAVHFSIDRPEQPGADALPSILDALEGCRSCHGPSVLKLPAGELHIYGDVAPGRFLAISNNDSGYRRVAFLLDGFEDLRIEGDGTHLVFHGEIVPFHLEGCRRVTVRGVTIDWARPFHFEGRVTGIDAETSSIDIEPADWCLWEIRDGSLWWVERPWSETSGASWFNAFKKRTDDARWERQIGWNIWLDPDRRAIAEGSNRSIFNAYNAEAGRRYRAEALENGRVRLSGVGCRELPRVGWTFVDKGDRGNRTCPAFHCLESNELNFEEVTVHHADGMGFIMEFCENVRLAHVNVVPSAGRSISTTADATHFVYCRGRIILEGCRFENMPDDGINVHGNYFRVEEVLSDGALWLSPQHPQHEHVDFAFPGDRVALVDPETFATVSEHRIVSVERRNSTRLKLVCEPTLSTGAPGKMLENLSWQANLEMRDCTVAGNRARAVLFSTRGSGLLERNTFRDQSMSAIFVEIDANLWHETGPVGQLVIRDNEIIGPSREFKLLPAIRITPEIGVEGRPPVHDAIRIENNRIEIDSGRLLDASSVDHLVFQKNAVVFRSPIPEGVEPVVARRCGRVSLQSLEASF